MKSIAAALSLLAVLLGFCLWNGSTMAQDTQRWQQQLEEADEAIRAEHWADARTALDRSYQDWSSHQPYLRVVTTHALLEEAEALYRRVLAFCSVEEDRELLADLSALEKQLDLLSQRELPTLTNIF